ncbi:unnamed protein product [Porites evermanni]|uniref:2'-5'-oligoadenylate synthetase 1 domain-containing protein n=1 Tax=Porites evermanni TaxID=104178 RepID=A0ABN8LRT4_9CNID|nr:unnamed protein product [Porites evermanni]
MVTKSIKDANQLSGKLPVILTELESRLQRSWKGNPWQLDSIETTNFSVQFNMSRSSEELVKVDLLPTFEANVGTDAEFYMQMVRDEENWKYYSAAIVKLQVEFVKKLPANVKDLIRLVKYWRKKYIPQSGSKHLPPSYLLELLTIHAWENANRPERFDVKIGFKAVMEALKNPHNLRVLWERYYRRELIPSRYIRKVLRQGPYVFDPANPTNNLYADVDSWGKVREVAEETLRKPLLSDVQVTDDWSNVNCTSCSNVNCTSCFVSDDIRDNSSLDLNKFIRDELQPNEEFHRLFNDAVDSLYRELQRDLQGTEYAVHNLIKGGSMAKGTAIKNDADLDCVMVMNSIDDASQLRRKLPAIKRRLESCLRGSIGSSWKLASEQKETRFSLQFSMSRYPGETVDVDLLPTFEANVRDIDGTFYRNMLGDTTNWQYYSAALVLIQRHFVTERPALVKDLIRLVKYWRKKFLQKKSAKRLPPSYLLELLTIHAWENANRPDRFDLKIGFKAVIEALKNHQRLRRGPYIIDPANPTKNLYDDVNCWPEVKRVAEETTQKPLLRNVWVSANWK